MIFCNVELFLKVNNLCVYCYYAIDSFLSIDKQLKLMLQNKQQQRQKLTQKKSSATQRCSLYHSGSFPDAQWPNRLKICSLMQSPVLRPCVSDISTKLNAQIRPNIRKFTLKSRPKQLQRTRDSPRPLYFRF